MDARTRVRYGTGVVLGLTTCATMVLALSAVYGLTAEYGEGSMAELGVLAVGVPVLLALLTVSAQPRARPRLRLAVVLGTLVVMTSGGLVAEALGADAQEDRLLEGSRDFACSGPGAELAVPAEVDRTWRELPRSAPVYGPVEASLTHCTAAVAGEGARTFPEYAGIFRRLDGWRVVVDGPERFVMVRGDVTVTVSLLGAPDRLTTIEVAAGR